MARIYLKTDFKQVYDKLQRMENAMQKKREILEEIGETCATEIRALAPKKSGTLASAIKHRVLDEDSVEVGLMENKKTPYGNKRPTLVYGVYNEFGTHKMASNSYMRIWYDSRRDEVYQMLLDRILSMLASA